MYCGSIDSDHHLDMIWNYLEDKLLSVTAREFLDWVN